MATQAASPTIALIEHAEKISQGAEAKIYRVQLHPAGSSNDASPVATEHILLKYRFHKQYRHPTLDASLTKSRVAGEARALLKCVRSGVNVPGIRMVDAPEGVLGIEWIDGKSVRFLLGGGAEGEEGEEGEVDDDSTEDTAETEEDPLQEFSITQDSVMELIGTEIAKMHQADVIHGDLTTSNMMLRLEDKAVDLYVLERAFSSTHPQSEPLFAGVLRAYEKKMGKEWPAISRRLDDGESRSTARPSGTALMLCVSETARS
ncbi:EKC/KEOPS complex subunit BUD32 [Trametes pubescens]|uniref:non-specific serine/threonine protein kinase n=1 Tax=Trametes pubescens TaxID=154538 RepID=A0A1M2VI90_TRAPU|nr:EKC/KEOPS complex subunit BUD32 [Trametes pubescens]